MTEPRITLAPAHGNPGEVQQVLDTLSRPGRPPLNLFLALARHPALLPDYLPLGARLLLTAGRDRAAHGAVRPHQPPSLVAPHPGAHRQAADQQQPTASLARRILDHVRF